MAKPKAQKFTAGSIVGLAVIALVVIAQQRGWLPTAEEQDGDGGTRTAQNDGQRDTPTQPETPPPAGSRHTSDDTPDRIDPAPDTAWDTAVTPGGDGGIGEHFRARRSDVIVTAGGVVSRMLPDDNEGSRHQKLIVTLSTGHTVLIAHNIDLAPRIPCDEGDHLRFRGEYEYTERGGVIHWTHHDPAGRHQPGWIDHDGVRYQ